MQRYSRGDAAAAFGFLLPSGLFFLVFLLIPMIYGLSLNLYDWNIMSPPRFVGLENWSRLFQDELFWSSIWVTFQYVLITIPLRIALAIVLALLVNRLVGLMKVYRAIFFAPVVTSAVAMSFAMRTILRGPGVLNFFVTSLGFDPVPWLASPFWAVIATSGFIVWQLTGQNMLVVLAGLQGVPRALYEAADIDGARDHQKFFRITLPLLTPYIFFLVITNLIFTMQVFDQIYVLTRGGPGYATTTLVYFIVNSAFQEFDMGYSAVLSIVLFLLLMAVTLIQWKMQKRWVFYG